MSEALDYATLIEQAKHLLKHREFENAIAVFQQARALDDDQPELHEALATTYTLAGNIEAAIEHFITVTRLAPRKATAFVNLGALYNRKEDYAHAIDMCRKAVAIDRKSADGYYNLGIAYRKLKQYALAVPAYREAIRINPQMTIAHQNLGNVYIDMGNHREAINSFKQALTIDPHFEKAKVGLERAEQLRDANKVVASPFGRLVDLEKGQSLSLDPSQFRRLSDEESADDRKLVHSLCLAIGRKAKELRDQLKVHLAPELTHLEHHVASQADLGRILNEFHPIAARFEQTCQELQNAVHALQIHEQQLKITS